MSDSNFASLQGAVPAVADIGRQAEAVFGRDPHGAVAHLRRFGEALTLELLDIHRLRPAESQFERLKQLQREAQLDEGALSWFHQLRKTGNRASHGRHSLTHSDAMRALKLAARLSSWFWRSHTTQPPPPPGGFIKPRAQDERTDTRIRRAEAEVERLAREKAEAEAAMAALSRRLEMPEVALHVSMEAAFQDLDASMQRVVSSFLERFRELPLDDDWPLEPVPDAADGKVRCVSRDGLTYVVVEPERGDILLLVYVSVDRAHACRWAASKRFEVNPALGTLQVFDVEEAQAAARGMGGGLLVQHPDQVLLDVGVPRVLLPSVRALASDDDLDAFCPLLPPEASDALYLLACGYSLEQVRVELDRRVLKEAVDAGDFAAAVHHPESRRSVLVLSGDEDLDAVLRGSVEAWRVFLHPDQRRLVRMQARGPVRVLGGAGTGKTVALLHRAAYLVQDWFVDPGERMLVTTFTRNLAADLQHHLTKLVAPEDLGRVDVIHLHGLVRDLWSAYGDGRRLARKEELARARSVAYTQDVLGLDPHFYDAEWQHVVQAEDIDDEVDYLRVRRAGRGEPLTRAKRRQVWRVLAAYRAQLDALRVVEPADQMRVLRRGLEAGEIPRRYAGLLVDETQDFGLPELKLIRAMVPPGDNDLFLVGDAHQRIYGLPVPMSACGIEIRGRSHRLRVNYRTTAKVRSWAVAALHGERFDDLDGGEDNLDGYRSLRVGVPPEVAMFRQREEELGFVVERIRRWLGDAEPESIGIGCPSKALAEEVRSHLEREGISAVVLSTDATQVGDGVRVGTFHRLKGLEFPRVVLTSVQQGLMPMRTKEYFSLAEEDKAVWDRKQRCLLYVASTRARDELVVVGVGARSELLKARA